MATANKLGLLRATKEEMKAALTEKGQNPGDVFSTYPDLVRAIKSGAEGIPAHLILVKNAYDDVIEAYDEKLNTYVDVDTDGETVTVGNTIRIRNKVKLIGRPTFGVSTHSGRTVNTPIGNDAVYEGMMGRSENAIAFLGIQDFTYVDTGEMVDMADIASVNVTAQAD